MKQVNLAAQLAAVETELTCLKMVLAQVRDRDDCGGNGTLGAEWLRSSTPARSERLMSGASLPQSAAHGCAAAREASGKSDAALWPGGSPAWRPSAGIILHRDGDPASLHFFRDGHLPPRP
jgi:hypothetical protein